MAGNDVGGGGTPPREAEKAREIPEPLAEILLRRENLDPALESHYTFNAETGWHQIHHPLLIEVWAVPERFSLYNEIYRRKKAHLEEKARRENWSGYVHIHEKPYRVDAFIEIQERLTDPEYWKLLGRLWVGSENIWQNLERWKGLLTCGGRNLKLRPLMMDRRERQIWRELPEFMTVYRGCKKHNREGLSWTLDRGQAEWFANRLYKKGIVLEREIPKSEALAYFAPEKEIVLDPGALKGYRSAYRKNEEYRGGLDI